MDKTIRWYIYKVPLEIDCLSWRGNCDGIRLHYDLASNDVIIATRKTGHGYYKKRKYAKLIAITNQTFFTMFEIQELLEKRKMV